MTLNTRQHTTHEEKRADPPPSGERRNVPSWTTFARWRARKSGGVGALYRGIEPAVIGTVTSQAVYNWWYAKLRGSYAKKYGENPGALGSLAVAAAAGSVNVLMTIPIWTVCVRMQAERAGADGEKKRRDAGDDAAEGEKTQTRWGERNGGEGEGRYGSTVFEPAATGAGAAVVARRRFSRRRARVGGERRERILARRRALARDGRQPRAAVRLLRVRCRSVQAGEGSETKGDERGRVEGAAPRRVDRGGLLIRLGGVRGGFRGEGLRDDADVPGASREVAAAGGGEAADPKMRYDGVVDAVRRIWEEEGCWAFYRGMGTKMTQTVFAAALMFAAKEEIAKSARRLLRKR